MLTTIPLRRWATPLTIGSFLLMAGTGISMFFDWNPGLVTVVHQWFSWAFLIAAVAHVVLNFRPFKSYLKSVWGRASIAIFGVLLILSFFTWGLITGPQMKDRIEHSLVVAPISALAQVAVVPVDELLQRFEANGFVATPDESIHDLVVRYGGDENFPLAIVFLPERVSSP
ncbi:DUF4405 domain-containing protein [Puniceibacterium sediminis]|uniref:Flavinylation-associated cytochrome domain-containing protein n=1 Tax=Puniceibacterium sediminis TaxID=1608407 RepID=A0A238Y5U9_9RHOB|nr:DUF4405 domain-containing protein [Puniceibacterium sediminis]SNR66188.1 protein of unknown function [Puniceibacterium sediminis]